MTKKILTLLLAISMVCTSVFAVFAIDEVSVNESREQSSTINTKDENKLSDINENELKKGETSEDATKVEESSASDELNSQILRSTPQQANNSGEKAYPGKVKLVDMWTNESHERIDKDREYLSPNDPIGKPEINGGLLRGLAKTFLAWSDKKPVDNGHLAEGARYFSPEDKIGDVFPNGIPKGAKLYGVYFSLIDEEEGLTGHVLDILKISGALRNFSNNFSGLINSNSVVINRIISGDNTMPDTDIYNETKTDQERTILDYYKKDSDNEVVLSSEFLMDPVIALITYKNPVGSNQLRPILCRDYNERRLGDKGFNTDDGKDTEYTYVDLNVKIGDGFEIPEKLFLEFSGYSWRPIYVMNENKEPLEIFDPNGESSLGSDKNSFNTLVNNKDPRVKFAIKPNGASNITVRMILRDKDNYQKPEKYDERISEKDVKPLPEKTITETILSNMTLRSMTKKEISELQPTLNNDELNKRVIRISDKEARKLAKTNGEKTLTVNGNIKGHMFVSAGIAQKGKFRVRLASNTEISMKESNKLKLGYVPNSLYYKFVSGTKGKDLPDEIIAKLPENKLAKDKKGVLDQDEISLSKYKDVKVSDGVWSFRSWYVTNDKFENDPNLKAVSKEALVNSPDDLYLLGVWVFKADKTSKVEKTPKTSDNQPISLALVLTIASITGMVLLQRKRKHFK